MQSHDPAPHKDASNESARETHFPAAYDKQADKRSEKAGQIRQRCCRPIVLNRDWQAKSQHPGVMHRPGADCHCDGAADPPIQSGSAARCSYSFSQFNRAVSAYHTEQHGQNYDPIVVITDNYFLRNHAVLLRSLKLRKLLSLILFSIAHVDLTRL